MTRKDDIQQLRAQLAAALATCGAKPQRWPQDMRARLSAFVEDDAHAKQLFCEERALDKLLACAPETQPPQGLEARIVAAALTPQAVVADGFARPGRRNGLGSSSQSSPMARSPRRIWPELAVLAASLFIGIVIGLSGQAVPALEGMGLIAANEAEDWGALAGSLFDPGGVPDQEAL